MRQSGVARALKPVLAGIQRRKRVGGAGGARVFLSAGISLALVLVSFSSACTTPSSENTNGVLFTWTVLPEPPRVGPATFTFTPRDTSGAPVTGANIQLEGNMSHPGMRPVFADALEENPGVYTAPFEFSMAGDWIILIEATLPDGRIVQDEIEVYGVQAAGM